jgi:mercuric ion binding protein
MRRVALLTALLFASLASAEPPRTVTLDVQNMTCGTCPLVVRKALERIPGVSAATVDFEHKTATVTFDPSRVKPTALTEATTDAGFPSTLQAAR